MKRILLFTGLLFAMSFIKAQDPLFLVGDKLLNVGIGVRGFPISVISASLDYCIADGIADVGSVGVGPYGGLGFSSSAFYLSAGVRGVFHYPVIENLDSYVGLGMGFRKDQFHAGSTVIHLERGLFLGANYPINETIVLFGEIGTAVSYLNVGITLRI